MTVISARQFTDQPRFERWTVENICKHRDPHELAITDVPPGWEVFLWEIDESLPGTRKSYDPVDATLRVMIRPTTAHDVGVGWLTKSMLEWIRTGSVTMNEESLIRVGSSASKPYFQDTYALCV